MDSSNLITSRIPQETLMSSHCLWWKVFFCYLITPSKRFFNASSFLCHILSSHWNPIYVVSLLSMKKYLSMVNFNITLYHGLVVQLMCFICKLFLQYPTNSLIFWSYEGFDPEYWKVWSRVLAKFIVDYLFAVIVLTKDL